jgi:hypothetical protein
MAGCPACTEFLPRFGRISAPLRARGLPVHVGDITKRGPAQAWAERLKVEATPTTVVLRSDGKSYRRVGAVSDAEIAKLLAAAVGR